jgi:hypothetical protein
VIHFKGFFEKFRKWRDFGCTGSEYRTRGGDPDKNCSALMQTGIWGDNRSRSWGQERNSGSNHILSRRR